MSVGRLKLRNTEAYMFGSAKRLVKLLKIEIGRTRTRTYSGAYGTRTIKKPIDFTGDLRKSLRVAVTKSKLDKSISGGNFHIGIEGLSYGSKLDEGGKVKAKISNLTNWLKKKAKLRDLETGKFIEQTPASLKYVAEKIKKKLSSQGMKPTNFIDDAIEMEMQRINSIADPVEKDIHLNIDEIFKRAGYEERDGEYRLKRSRIRVKTGEIFNVTNIPT
tara:strand:- start:19679 stop:20332 length:654 start_codon:yes stop_codon:yes gene_type:complete